MSGTGRVGQLLGDREDLAQARSIHWGSPARCHPGGPWALPLATEGPLPSPPPSGLRPGAHTRMPSSSTGKLGSAPFLGLLSPASALLPPPPHTCVPRTSGSVHASCWSSPLTRVHSGLTVCPAHCQSGTESGRASLPLAPSVDGWVCFSPGCFGFRGKKKIPK